MNLSYQTSESPKWNEISVEFDPPLSGYEEVKPRLMQMKADAEEGLGMVSCPSKLREDGLTHVRTGKSSSFDHI